ncbi:MAG: ATPase domain-containing protein [archaeon]
MVQKVAFDIPGMDDVLRGGVLPASSILITGGPGTGKSIFAFQFIFGGAKKNIPGLYITSEQTIDALKASFTDIGWDMDDYENNGLITILEQSVTSGKMLSLEAPLALIKKKKIQRVVLDSLTLFEFVYSKGPEFRKGIISFLKQMKEAGITVLVTSERDITDIDAFLYKPEDYLFDGMIVLSKIRKGSSFERILHVVKMRGQEHAIDIFPFTIGRGGIKVMPKELPFSLIEQDFTRARK